MHITLLIVIYAKEQILEIYLVFYVIMQNLLQSSEDRFAGYKGVRDITIKKVHIYFLFYSYIDSLD